MSFWSGRLLKLSSRARVIKWSARSDNMPDMIYIQDPTIIISSKNYGLKSTFVGLKSFDCNSIYDFVTLYPKDGRWRGKMPKARIRRKQPLCLCLEWCITWYDTHREQGWCIFYLPDQNPFDDTFNTFKAFKKHQYQEKNIAMMKIFHCENIFKANLWFSIFCG